MVSRIALTVFVLGGGVWCAAMVGGGQRAKTGGAGQPFKPVAPVKSLMHGQKTFFKEIAKELSEPVGGDRDEDEHEDRNEEIQEAAEVLAELANVNRYNKDKDDYRAWATQLRDTALKLAAEAAKKGKADDGRMKALHQKLKNTCTACHDVYQ